MSDERFSLVLGTGNAKKVVELRRLLPADRFDLQTLADLRGTDTPPIEVDETGETFAENAALKASQQAKHLGRWVFAEDSGLTVDALGGDPGVRSARYAGTHGDDEANNDKLLAALDGVPPERRGAAFHCHMALADPTGEIRVTASGTCRGRIAEARHGDAGFGYDPLFIVPEYHRTFAQLGMAVKGAISHRAVALRQFLPGLRRLSP